MSPFFWMSFARLWMLLVLGSGTGLPLGIPPAAEDPLISRVAPEQCLVYLSWSGMAEPDPASKNQTEQLLAEKEVQRLFAELDARLVEFAKRSTRDDPQAAAMVEPMALVLKTVLTHPTAIFVTQIEPNNRKHIAGNNPKQPIRGGMVVNVGDKAAEIREALLKFEALLVEGGDKPAEEAGGWRRVTVGPDQFVIEWAVKGKYLIVGLGDGEADKIRQRAKQEPPAWLAQIREQLAVPRPSNLLYVNVAGLVKLAAQDMPPDGRKVFEALGLDRIQSFACMTGLDDVGCVSRTQLAIDGDMTGLLSVLAAEPLSKEHLSVIPADATLAAAGRLDLAKVYKELLDVVGRVEPQAREEMLQGVGAIEERMKLRLADDVFASLGDVWRVYNSPGEGGLVFTGLTAVVDVRDHDRLVAANGKLVMATMFGGAAKDVRGGRGGRSGVQIRQTKFGEHTIFQLAMPGEFMPFAPSWCITEKELVASLFPQNIVAYLSRPKGSPTLAEVPAVASLFDKEPPLAVFYCDTPGLFKLFYPIVQIVAQVACSQMQRVGVDIDVSLLPSAPAFLRHVQPGVSTVRRTKAGIVMETRRTLPAGMGGGLFLTQMPFWLFADSAVPPSSQAASMNNLKMIVLGMHNYHDVNMHFPATAAGQKPGQPPVSWRVLILPYIEQASLYNQYRFDEPWDSENNKRVAAQMPAVYRAPGSRVGTQGKTNYLAVVGDPYMFAADKGRRFADVTDGISNTIMVVEVSDAKAVPWTKPDDFTPDAKNPIADVVGLRPGGFLVAMGDGSVRRISAGIDPKVLYALFTRAGGEAAMIPNNDDTGAMAPEAPIEVFEEKPAAPRRIVVTEKKAAMIPAPVRGVITCQGKPVDGATITLVPVGDMAPARGKTDATGRFSLSTFQPDDGAVPGRYRVTVSRDAAATTPGGPAVDRIPAKYGNPDTSGLEIEVKSGSNEIDINLH